jgi:hypothetical protein
VCDFNAAGVINGKACSTATYFKPPLSVVSLPFLYSLPLAVLKSSASPCDAKSAAKIAKVVSHRFARRILLFSLRDNVKNV